MNNPIVAILVVSVMSVKREWVAAFTLASVGCVTVFSLIGLHPSMGWVTLREGLFLGALNLFFASVYFEVVSPSRKNVPKYVTSSLAIFAGIVGTYTVNAFFHITFISRLHYVASSAFLILIVFNWFWYEIVVLKSFRQQIEDAVDTAPLPDAVEDVLVEDDDSDE